jgi:hypothetical protein
MLPKKKKSIDERLILLRNIILLRKSQLVTSYTLKLDVQFNIEITIFLLYKVAEISSHGKYSYYGSVFIAFEVFSNHNYC